MTGTACRSSWRIERCTQQARAGVHTRVSIVPVYSNFLNDRLFQSNSLAGTHAGNVHWLQPFVFLRYRALQDDIEMHTCDGLDARSTDVMIFMDLPGSPRTVRRLRAAAPGIRTVLMLVESPLGRRFAFNPANHGEFDAVLTFHPGLVDGERYFPMLLPVSTPAPPVAGRPFEDRKIACLISTYSAKRRQFGINLRRRGWRFSAADAHDYVALPGRLQPAQTSLARALAERAAHSVDVFGAGWTNAIAASGTRNSALASCLRGPLEGSKLDRMPEYRFNVCYENCENDIGYVSEKIFDALYAGCVPVYRGNISITDHVPSDCFVSARSFPDDQSLARYLVECPAEEWKAYRDRGQHFIRSGKIEPFLPEAFAASVLHCIRAVAGES